MAGYPSIRHGEECMRDGMQIESRAIPVADKIRLLDALSETGLKEIAVGSFVSPRWTPQMADVEDVIRGFRPKPGVRYTAAAFNERGRERARAFTPPLSESHAGAATQVNMCDVFAQRNYNRTQLAELKRLPDVVQEARDRGVSEAGIGLLSAFGSNWLGEFGEEQHLRLLGPPAPGLERGGHQGYAREHRRSDELEHATPCGATPGGNQEPLASGPRVQPAPA